MRLRRVTVILEDETLERVEEVKARYGFLKLSEAFRFVVKKGLEAIEKEKQAEVAARG